jgi:hypothetical protein
MRFLLTSFINPPPARREPVTNRPVDHMKVVAICGVFQLIRACGECVIPNLRQVGVCDLRQVFVHLFAICSNGIK